jgi:hypothetical protein
MLMTSRSLIAGRDSNSSAPGLLTVQLTRGDGSYSAPVTYGTPSPVLAIAVRDLNGDNRPDVTLACGAAGLVVLWGSASGALISPTPFAAPNAFSIAVDDVNADGSPDIVTSEAWIR